MSGTDSKANGSLTEGAAAGGDALVVGGAEEKDGMGGASSSGGSNGIHIKSLLRGTDHWMILDARGGLWRLDILSNEVTQVKRIQCVKGSVCELSSVCERESV